MSPPPADLVTKVKQEQFTGFSLAICLAEQGLMATVHAHNVLKKKTQHEKSYERRHAGEELSYIPPNPEVVRSHQKTHTCADARRPFPNYSKKRGPPP